METPSYNPEENLRDDVTQPIGTPSDDNVAAESSQKIDDNTQADIYPERPLPKIHPNLHHHGKYKMFSNHSSSNDIPKTSTGI